MGFSICTKTEFEVETSHSTKYKDVIKYKDAKYKDKLSSSVNIPNSIFDSSGKILRFCLVVGFREETKKQPECHTAMELQEGKTTGDN